MEMMRFLSFDLQVVCNMVDKDGNSLLFLAVRKGCNRVALHILMYAPYYSLSAKNGSTPLLFVMNSSEEVLRQLLERHPEYVKAINYTVLRKWTESGKLWPLEYLLDIAIAITPESKRHLVDLIYQTNNHGNNIFHVAAKGRKFKAARILANVYREEKRANESTPKRGSFKEAKHDHDHDHNVPWLIPNKKGETPLGLDMTDYKRAYDEYNDHLTQEKIGMNLVIKGKNELLFLAIEKGLYQAAEGILDIQHKYGWSLYSPQGWEIWDAALKFSEQATIWVARRLLSLTANRDEFITHTLYSVSKNGKTKFLKWMLKNTSALRLAPLAWIGACHKGHFSTIMAFINNCEYFTELCFEEEDTPLHHIRFKVYEQYEDIMKNPIMSRLKNFRDFEGQTPLHKAVKNRELLLTKLLLSMDDVFRSIKDKSNKTAMDLLVEACDESWEWDEMCKHIGIIPGVKMTYFQDKTNMLEVRNTLSVVAVLLATITFTAGFTLPGGVKSDTTGKATLGNKAAFLIFLIADALAMCCSMLVLVCLIWSMVCDYYKSLLLVNRSVPVLMLALYSTLVAFMSGVYVVIPHKSLWVAIVILVMCFTFIILSKRSVMDKLINKPYPTRKYKDKFQMMEQVIYCIRS